MNELVEDLKISNDNLYCANKMLEKEIERLNKLLSIEKDYRERFDKDNQRLNNIINELEKYINEEYIYDELGMKIFDASELQDKLQELKGSKNDEQK